MTKSYNSHSVSSLGQGLEPTLSHIVCFLPLKYWHIYLAGELGFEPRLTVLETVSLPLADSPMESDTPNLFIHILPDHYVSIL